MTASCANVERSDILARVLGVSTTFPSFPARTVRIQQAATIFGTLDMKVPASSRILVGSNRGGFVTKTHQHFPTAKSGARLRCFATSVRLSKRVGAMIVRAMNSVDLL